MSSSSAAAGWSVAVSCSSGLVIPGSGWSMRRPTVTVCSSMMSTTAGSAVGVVSPAACWIAAAVAAYVSSTAWRAIR